MSDRLIPFFFPRIGNPALRAITKIGIPTSVFDAKMARRLTAKVALVITS